MNNPFSKDQTQNNDATGNEAIVSETQETENSNTEVTTTTKVKVVAALLVVGFASYVAYWVQEPSDIKADVLSSTQQSEEAVLPTGSEMVAMEMPLTTETTESVTESEVSADVIEVSIEDFTFVPGFVEVKKGTTVKWTNNDTVPHTVTADDFSSGTLNKGESYEHTFDTDGEFAYTCSFHPQMQAKVVVGVSAPVTLETESAVTLPTSEVDMQELPAVVTETLPVTDVIENLAPAAPELTEEVMPTVVKTSVSSATPSGGELTAEEKAMKANTHGAANETQTKSLAKSGPEEVLYGAMFLGILYFNRKKLMGLAK